MSKRMNRQTFLATSAKVAAAAAVGTEPVLWPTRALAGPPVVRRDVGNLAINDPILETYRQGVLAMRALPDSDPRSWTYQAAIHGTKTTPVQTAWNTCPHGSYYFWPWHRMYLYYFERIIRNLTGDTTWALPYWNYESASERQLPAAFRVSTSPLYTAARAPGWNAGAAFQASQVDSAAGMSFLSFGTATSWPAGATYSLELTPHNVVHGLVGGWTGLMGDPKTAAQDPIFFLHHANIDRLWNLWLAQGGGRVDPLLDTAWKTKQYTFFTENKSPVNLTPCDVLRAAEQLNYTYENEPTQVKEYCVKPLPWWIYFDRFICRWPLPPNPLPRHTILNLSVNAKVRSTFSQLVASSTDTSLLQLGEVTTDAQPGVIWQVYVGLRKGEAPTTASPAFVGNLAMFGMGVRSDMSKSDFMPAKFAFPADRALARFLKTGGSTLRVELVAAGPLINGKPSTPLIKSPVHVGSVTMQAHRRKH